MLVLLQKKAYFLKRKIPFSDYLTKIKPDTKKKDHATKNLDRKLQKTLTMKSTSKILYGKIIYSVNNYDYCTFLE